HVYVADGTPNGAAGDIGDGAVEFSVADIPAIGGTPVPCTGKRRLPASDPADSPRRARPLKSLALSPAVLDADGTTAPAGRFILGVTSSDAALCLDRGARACPSSIAAPGIFCADQGLPDCGGGRVILLANHPAGGRSAVLVAPGTKNPPTLANPFGLGAPMVPLRPAGPAAGPGGPAREVAFLGRAKCPPATSDRQDLNPPRTAARVRGNTTTTPALMQRTLHRLGRPRRRAGRVIR